MAAPLTRLKTLLAWRRVSARRDSAGLVGSVASFRETFRQRPRSGSAELLFSEIRNAFDPASRLIQTWHQLVLLCILYELFVLPYMLAFESTAPAGHRRRLGASPLTSLPWSSRQKLVALYACELVFCLDIYVQLNTGYYEDGNVLRDTRKSRLKYLKSWAFVLDVAALPPLALVVPARAVSGGYRASLELHKLLRLWRLPRLISNLDDIYARYFVVLKLSKVILTTLFVSHIVACGRFTFGYDDHHIDHWLPKAPTEEHSTQRKYLMSLFWAFGLLTGLFEGELPHTVAEFIFNIVVALCGFSLFTYLCATFFMLSKCEGGEAETADARVNQFKHLLAFHRVPERLQKQAVGYLKRYYAQAESNDREAAKLLCPSISVDIQIELLQETVASIPVFQGCSAQFIKAVTSLLEMVSYPAQFVLFRTGEHGDAMYVIHSGVLNTLVNGKKVRELRKGSFFGEVAVFANVPRSATMVSATYCTLYRLSRVDADKLTAGYPRFAALIRATVAQMLKSAQSAAATPTGNVDPSVTGSSSKVDTESRRTSTRASLLQAVRLKRVRTEKKVQKHNLAANQVTPNNEGKKHRATSFSANVERASSPTRMTLISPADTITVSGNANFRGPSGEANSKDSNTGIGNPLRSNRGSRPSVSRHLSWKSAPSSKVLPEDSTPMQRRISFTGEILAGIKPESLVHKSKSQLELLKSSLLRIGRGSIESMTPDAMKLFYDQIQRLAAPKSAQSHWWSRFLFRRCINAESRARMMWLLILQLDLCYNWVVVPLQLAFPLFDRPRWYIQVLNIVADVILWLDIYVNFNLSFSINSEMIFDTSRSAVRYLRSGYFVADTVCSLPYDWALGTFLGSKKIWSLDRAALRVPKLLRVWRLFGHLREVEEYLVLNSKQRLMFFGFILVMLYHIVACLYFSITYWEGFSPSSEAWIPSDDIYLGQVNSTMFIDSRGQYLSAESDDVYIIQQRQYFRSLYYAANVLAALGKTIEPSTDRQYGLALIFMLSGFIITAIVVDNVQKRFTASALEQKEFFATRARIQLFLKRQDAPLSIHQRVNSFLDYWWSSHRGAIIGELLDELPETIKRDIVRSICSSAMETIGMLFPQIWTEDKDQAHHVTMATARAQVEEVFLDNLKFVLYGQGEIIYREGDFPSGLYFLLEGQIRTESKKEPPRRIPIGGYFGSAALDVHELSEKDAADPCGHTEQVTAESGCIVVYISREHLQAMQTIFPELSGALKKSEKSLQAALRVTKAAQMDSGVTKTFRPGPLKRTKTSSILANAFDGIQKTRLWKIVSGQECLDPDGLFITCWELWIFAAVTIQCTLVIYHICYGVHTAKGTNIREFSAADTVMIVLEVCFLIDSLIRARLGFYEFGNKVMSLRQIKAHYLGSKYFMIDILALIPFFPINWFGSSKRIEIVNANKLLRLLKSSSQFRALDAKHVKLTLELRLVRLVYYTFLASHTFGCVWFDFAAHNSGIHPAMAPSFGTFRWLPYKSLEFASRSLQYFGSVFWSFGLMTASSTGEVPKTVSQCVFSVITMTSGFFLFAYVVGNFLDVIELQDSENRHFISKLSSLRHLLAHFKLPPGIEGKFKTYFFFKRFHTITQEHVLERVLPPSLLVDIRMFQLQPMIVKVAFLAGMEDSVTRLLVSQFTQILVVKDMYICKYGEEGKEMFFIFTGVLDIYIPLPPGAGFGSTAYSNDGSRPSVAGSGTIDEMSGLIKVNQITAGGYFGEAALFTKAPRNAYVKAKTSCILYRLSRESLELVFDRFPDWKEKVLRIVKIQQQQQQLMRTAAENQDSEAGGNGSPGKRRSVKRSMSRLDLIDSRAEDLEALVLANIRGGRVRKIIRFGWTRKWMQSNLLVKQWLKPLARRVRQWAHFLLNGAEVQSPFYLFWLRLVTFSTVYIALITPYRFAYDSLDRWSPLPVLARAVESLCAILFCWDIWFHFRIRDSLGAMELYEQDHLQGYKRERLLWDALAAFPLELFVADQFLGVERSTMRKWLRLNRCFKVANLVHYRLEVNRRSVTYEFNRLVTLWLLYLLMMYWTSCAYVAVAIHVGFGDDWQAWLPAKSLYETEDSGQLILRVLRGFMFAVTAFVKKGRTFTPTKTLNLSFTIAISFIGQLIMALMIGEVASLFILYIDNEVEFRKNHIAVEHFLSRKRINPKLRRRCNAFLTSWWSSHAGVNYQIVFDDLPPTVRTEGVTFIARTPLGRFMDKVFRPLTRNTSSTPLSIGNGDHDQLVVNGDIAVENLVHAMAQHLYFEGYPRGEDVVVEGMVCRAVFFIVRGYLYSKSVSNPSLYHAMRFRPGDYFGEKGLLGHSVSLMTVTTVRACDLFVLRCEHLIEAIKNHPYFSVLYRMARDIVRQKTSAEEYFAEAINKDRREVLRRRLSAPMLSNSPTPTISRSSQAGKQTFRHMQDSPLLQRVLQQSSQLEWEEAFRQFMELLVPKGTLNVSEEEVEDEEQDPTTVSESRRLLVVSSTSSRKHRAKSQFVSSSQFNGMSGFSGFSKSSMSRALHSPSPGAEAGQPLLATNPAPPPDSSQKRTNSPTVADLKPFLKIPTSKRMQIAPEEGAPIDE